MIFNYLLESIIGFSAGLIIAAGIFAFISTIGIMTRLIAKTKTTQHIRLYEDFIVLGAIFGNCINLFEFHLPIGNVGAAIFGGFSGVFVGCLIMSLAETLNALPVLSRNVKFRVGLQAVIFAIAFGKLAGALIFFME